MLHELFETVLSRQELSRAGELFSLEDHEVLPCASEVLHRVRGAISLQSYASDDNAQSVVEICLSRVLAAIRDYGYVERYGGELVSLLETCLQHDLTPRAPRSEHPPHAKISADVMSCIFLHQASSRALTARSVGATVRFLHRGNRELARSVTRHLCLTASQHADLLLPHVQPVVDSIIAGNYALCKVLPSIYAIRQREPAITEHVLALLSLLSQCEPAERLSLLSLFELMAKSDATLLEGNLSQLTAYLDDENTAASVLRIFVEVSNSEPHLLVDILPKVQQASLGKPQLISLTGRLYANVANTNRDLARLSLDLLSLLLADASPSPAAQVTILREIKSILDTTSASLSSLALDKINQLHADSSSPSMIQFYLQQIRRQKCSLRDKLQAHSQHLLSQPNAIHHAGATSAGLVVQSQGCHAGACYHTSSPIGAAGGGYGETSHFVLPHGVTTLSACTSASTASATSTVNGGGSGSQQQLFSSSRPSLTSSHTGLGGGSSTTPLLNGSLQTLGLMPRNNTATVNAALTSGAATGVGSVGHAANSHVQLPVHRSLGTLGSRAVLYAANASGGTGAALKTSGTARMGVGLPQTGHTAVCSAASSARSTSASISVLLDGPLTGSTSPKGSSGDSSASASVGAAGTSVSTLSRRAGADKHLSGSSGLQQKISTFGRSRVRHNNNSTNNNSNNNGGNTNSKSNSSNYSYNTNKGRLVAANNIGGGDGDIAEDEDEESSAEKARLVAASAAGLSAGGVPFEPLRDAVQHFSEKHLDKIRAFMAGVFARLPLPLKCTIEERHSGKKYAKLHFGCQGKGGNCLYDRTLFASKTKHARIWIHLMFLAVQARSPLALGQRDPSLAALRHCWDSLRPADGRSFLALVTSAFPSAKDMECLMSELRSRRFLDVFEYNGALQMWACFLCNHPDRAHGFLQESLPVIEGQLKEKRRRWKLFRQWRTKYFTLSGANLSCRELSSDSKEQPVGEVQSVRAIQGRNRHIPKAFEIFTADDKAFVLKAASRRHTEEWVQCLSIALARTHASSQTSSARQVAGLTTGQGGSGTSSSSSSSSSGGGGQQQTSTMNQGTHREHRSVRVTQATPNENSDYRLALHDPRDFQTDNSSHHQALHSSGCKLLPGGGVSPINQITQRL